MTYDINWKSRYDEDDNEADGIDMVYVDMDNNHVEEMTWGIKTTSIKYLGCYLTEDRF